MIKSNTNDAKRWFDVLVTGDGCQTAMMTLEPGESSGERNNEHPQSEQILLVIEGEVTAEIGDGKGATYRGRRRHRSAQGAASFYERRRRQGADVQRLRAAGVLKTGATGSERERPGP